jgi:glycerol-3-phosphate cytidylyltransferase-like family protein
MLDWPSATRRALDVSAGGKSWKVVTGYFDPLLAGHVRRLEEIAADGQRLLVIVTEPEESVLPATDRAALVAAVAVVGAVAVAPESGLDELLAKLPSESVVREERVDRRRSMEFAASVRRRSKPQTK